MTIAIRTAVPDDAKDACDLLRRSISECCEDDHRHDAEVLAAWLGNKTPDNVRCWFGAPANHCLVATVDDKVAGVAIMTRQGKIVLFYVAPEMRFVGAGKAMLQALESQAKAWGLASLQVHSTLTARCFYARNGYIEGGAAKTSYGAEGIYFSKRLVASYPQKPACRCSLAAG
jgi:GNAT superfamily N-acetyltransferase